MVHVRWSLRLKSLYLDILHRFRDPCVFWVFVASSCLVWAYDVSAWNSRTRMCYCIHDVDALLLLSHQPVRIAYLVVNRLELHSYWRRCHFQRNSLHEGFTRPISYEYSVDCHSALGDPWRLTLRSGVAINYQLGQYVVAFVVVLFDNLAPSGAA